MTLDAAKAIKAKLCAELLPGVALWRVTLTDWAAIDGPPGGWSAGITLRSAPYRNRWRHSEYRPDVGSRGWDGRADCLYKTPRRAVEALRNELVNMRAVIGVALGVVE